MFDLQLPPTRKPWTTLSNPCNKVRGIYFSKEVFLCLYHCVVLSCVCYHCVSKNMTKENITIIVLVPTIFKISLRKERIGFFKLLPTDFTVTPCSFTLNLDFIPIYKSIISCSREIVNTDFENFCLFYLFIYFSCRFQYGLRGIRK